MTSTASPLNITATVNHFRREELQSVTAWGYVDTAEQAAEIAASFPKSLKVDGHRVDGNADGFTGYVTFTVRLTPSGVNKGVNETGIKRYRSFRKHLTQLGIAHEWVLPYGNSIDEETFESLVAAAS